MSSLKSNITKGFLWQGISIASTFLLIPISISYLGKEDYGLWVVLYSFILLLQSCDLGISSSFRNLLTKLLTENKKFEAKCLVSTSYTILAILSVGILILLYVIQKTVGVDALQAFPVSMIISILCIVFLDYNLKLALTVYTSNQKAFVLPLSTAIVNVCFLAVVAIFNTFEIGDSNRLFLFCFVFPICSVLTNFCVTICAYNRSFNFLSPNVLFFKQRYLKPLLGSGMSFFIIQISMAILTQYTSILIFKYGSSEVVVDVSILDKYFGIVSVLGAVILFPFWSKFTQKYTEKDFEWISKCIFKLELFFLITCALVFILWYLFPSFLNIWMAGKAEIASSLSIIVAIKYLMIFLNSVYSYYLNGIGKLKIQLVLYFLGAAFIIPFSYLLFDYYGVEGVVGYSAIVYFVMAISQKIYIVISLQGIK
ncbi:TPA: hypothetical protein I7774_18965 [Vibrio vulnificus]|nr:hypothetical protein [Vibrio vulnificus]